MLEHTGEVGKGEGTACIGSWGGLPRVCDDEQQGMIKMLKGYGEIITIISSAVVLILVILGAVGHSNDQFATMQRQLATMQAQITSMQVQITSMQAEIASMRTEIAAMQAEIATMRTEITIMRAQIITIQEQFMTMQEQSASVQGQIRTMQIQVSKNQATLAEFIRGHENAHLYITGDIEDGRNADIGSGESKN